MTVLFVWLFTLEGMVSSWIALAVFGLASLTDWLDGYLARKLNQQTAFGIFMDPLADKILVLSALLIFVWENLVAVWIVIIIVARESVITSVRILAEGKGVSLGAMPSGKQKLVSQIVAIIGILVILCIQRTISANTGQPWDTVMERMGGGYALAAGIMRRLPNILLFIAMAFSVISGVIFIRKHRELFTHLISSSSSGPGTRH
jgi:CDP-diacylglycerol--glycerol-3-phosphate 3-phosphatidyltransferase